MRIGAPRQAERSELFSIANMGCRARPAPPGREAEHAELEERLASACPRQGRKRSRAKRGKALSDQQDDFGDFFDNWLGGIRPGSKVANIAALRYRQGSDPRDWSQAGGSKYLPGEWHFQCGSQKWTGGAAASGGFEITFPVQFAEPPVIIGTPTLTTPLFKDVRIQINIQSAAVVEVYWFAAVNLTLVWVNWLAIGPIGLST